MQPITDRVKVMMALNGYNFSYGPFYCPNCWREYAFFSRREAKSTSKHYLRETRETPYCNECCGHTSGYVTQFTLAEFP